MIYTLKSYGFIRLGPSYVFSYPHDKYFNVS